MISTITKKIFTKVNIISLAVILAGLLMFFFVLNSPFPQWARDFSTKIVNENFLLLGGLFILLVLAYLIPGEPGTWIRWILIALLFAIFLRGYWEIKRTAFFQLFGFQPWVDAAEYYTNSQRILVGLPMQGSTNGRPMFSAFLSILLWVTQNDLIQTISLLTLLMAIVFYWAGESIRKFGGAIIAAGVITFTFMFFRNYLGALSSESLGLILSLPAWIMLYQCLTKPSLRQYSLALFILTIAFVTRAGPLLVLPALSVAGYFIFRDVKGFWKKTGWVIGPVAAGFGVNAILTQILSAGRSASFTSYFYSLYGMAAGGKGWGFIKIAEPDIYYGLAEPERTRQIIAATFDLIKADPGKLIQSMLSQYGYFFGNIDTSIFSYLFARTPQFNLIMIILLYALIVFSFVNIWRHRRKAEVIALAAILIGILASVPLVPPQDESHMRPYAVVVPVLSLLPFLFVFVFSRIKQKAFILLSPIELPDNGGKSYLTLAGFPIVLIVITLFIPIILFHLSKPSFTPQSCAIGETAFVAYHKPTNTVQITPKSNDLNLHLISRGHFNRKLHDIYMSDALTIFKHLSNNSSFEYVVNTANQTSVWLIDDSGKIDDGSGWYRGCGIYDFDPIYYHFSSLNVTSAERILTK